jgi:3-hydroxyisobutyrate dehydrogenase-like beta-hydroxyacid dehydrogenase
MGLGMATNLVKQGYSVTGYDVYPPSLEKFQKAGGIPSTSLSESAKDKSFYIVMVASAAQAQPALFAEDGIVNALPKGATLLLTSTVPSSYAQSVEAELTSIGREDIFFIDAPVSGGAGRAADGTLTIMAGASSPALEKGQWLLAEMSAPSKLFIVEGGIGQGSNMKMVHQVLAAIQILAVSEGYGFGARLGLNGKEVFDAVVGSEGWSWMFENRSQRTLKEDYFPGASAVTIILKDTVCFPPLPSYHVYNGRERQMKMLIMDVEHHHRPRAPTRLPHPAVQHRRASLLRGTGPRLGRERRRRHCAPVDLGACVQHHQQSLRRGKNREAKTRHRPAQGDSLGGCGGGAESGQARQHPTRADLRVSEGCGGREQAV